MLKTKYVILRTMGEEYAIIFPMYVNHSEFKHMGPRSAGFCSYDEINGVSTFGKSESLGIESRDTDRIHVAAMLRHMGFDIK